MSTGVVIAAPFDFAIYRANGGSTLVGNSGYTLLTQIEPGTEIRVIPVGQTEEVVITDQGGGGGTLDQVLSKIKVQRVTLADNPMIIALDTD